MFFVYRLIDFNERVIYVGRTENLTTRYLNHKNGVNSPITEKNSFSRMEYVELSSKTDMFIYELFFINAYRPILNVRDVMDMPSIEMEAKLNNVKWKTFDINKNCDFTRVRRSRGKYNRKKVEKIKVNKEAYNFYKKREGLLLVGIANYIGVNIHHMSRLFSQGFDDIKLCKMCEILKCNKEDLVCEKFIALEALLEHSRKRK